MTPPERVFVDANELFPFSVMDLVLSLAEDRLLDFVWTEELLNEWERVIVREQKRSPQTAASVSATVREFFAPTRIDPTFYRDHTAEVPGKDPDDQVHTAACAFGDVDVLLTRNTADFPSAFLAAHDVRVATADDYLTDMLKRRPAAVLDTVYRLTASKQNPPITVFELADGLERGGAARLAAALHRRLTRS
ncbi:MAG: PIN domain-containing protein [Trebonia sp.]